MAVDMTNRGASVRRMALLLAVVLVSGGWATSPPSPPSETSEVSAEAPEKPKLDDRDPAEVASEAVEAANAAAEEVAAHEEPAKKEAAPRDVFTGHPVDGSKRYAKEKSGTASMQWVITKSMRRELSGLGYTGDEVENLDPQRAAQIIKLKIQRPTRGMPDRWRKDYNTSPVLTLLRNAKAAGVPVLLAALAIWGVSMMGGGGGAPAASSRAHMSRVVEPSDVDKFVPAPDRLWLDVQIDRIEWWWRQRAAARRRSAAKK